MFPLAVVNPFRYDLLGGIREQSMEMLVYDFRSLQVFIFLSSLIHQFVPAPVLEVVADDLSGVMAHPSVPLLCICELLKHA